MDFGEFDDEKRDVEIGAIKEALNTLLQGGGGPPPFEFTASNANQAKGMMIVFAAGLLLSDGDNAGTKAEAILTRLGKSPESATRLGKKAEEAAEKIGIHGVSVTERGVLGEVSRAVRSEVEKFFKVHDTPTVKDPLHRTIELPKPVTKQVADAFNRLFGRK